VDLRDRRVLYNGFGDGLAKAIELVATPAIFAFGGVALDRWLGVVPIFTIALTLFSLAGVGYMTWFRYDEEMRRHETDLLAERSQPRPRSAA
jgi:Putative F0F1-ATPase subunit Ca2+/Mg2+ transporter